MERSYWYGQVLDLDFDTMFHGPIDLRFQEEPYQGEYSQKQQVILRPSVSKKPAVGKNSVYRRRVWKN